MSRTARGCLAAVLFLGAAQAAAAQGQPATAEQAAHQAREAYGPPPDTEPCSAEQEAAAISGEIVVCARLPSEEHRLRSGADARRRYAAATMDAGDPRAPDFEPKYPGVAVARGCFIGPCPKPRAIVTDFAALPQAPPGSDADRIAQGLAPIGNETGTAAGQVRTEELGLPLPLAAQDGVAVQDAGPASGPASPENR